MQTQCIRRNTGSPNGERRRDMRRCANVQGLRQWADEQPTAAYLPGRLVAEAPRRVIDEARVDEGHLSHVQRIRHREEAYFSAALDCGDLISNGVTSDCPA